MFGRNFIFITGLLVSFHNTSISFHYIHIDASNKAASVTVGNLFFFLNNFSFSFIVALELNLTAEKLEKRLHLIHGQEHLKEKINILSRRAAFDKES